MVLYPLVFFKAFFARREFCFALERRLGHNYEGIIKCGMEMMIDEAESEGDRVSLDCFVQSKIPRGLKVPAMDGKLKLTLENTA
ncbi:hypothetical protein NL676_022899 [Syzygium grande]|nr:hypothetical protein NL676_022899 [Syzygium grande]